MSLIQLRYEQGTDAVWRVKLSGTLGDDRRPGDATGLRRFGAE
jgi:hypothetical protein